MISLDGVSSELIARNQSWVRQQAGALMRGLPPNVDKADLVQVGLIAVAQAALAFEWEGDRDSEAAREAFVRYARLRVRGAMIDELRQMDHLERSTRRKLKVLEIARERWRSRHGREPTLGELHRLSGMPVDEIAALDQAGLTVQNAVFHDDPGSTGFAALAPPATPRDEVEARVETTIVLRRLEKFFATLPERDRRIIDAYLGVGLSPVALAESLHLSPSRVSQLYKEAVQRIAEHLGHEDALAPAPPSAAARRAFDALVAQRERERAAAAPQGDWADWMETTLTAPGELI